MNPYKNIVFLFVLVGGAFQGISQEKTSEFPPYTIDYIYEKLNKNYPFIIPIQPLSSKDIVSKENVVYKTIGDRTLQADIYMPAGKSKHPYPTVLLIHGGGWLTGSKENQRVMAQHLALNGFVAITVSYRLGYEAPYPAAVLDLKDAVRWTRENATTYNINPNQIAVLGGSAGAHLATLIGVTPNSSLYGKDDNVSDAVQAIINIDGIVSFIHPEAAAEGKMASIWLSGSREENYHNWKEASPLEYVNGSAPPILFINSSQPRFHAGRDDMITILDMHHIYSEVHTLDESPHSFWLMQPWFDTTLTHVINFLNKVIK